jgi:hypothetical protein
MFGFSFVWLWNILFAAGAVALVASWILGMFPIISTYKLPIQILGILALLVSTWFLGQDYNEKDWKERAEESARKIQEAEVKADKINDDLTASQKENEELRKKKNKEVIKYIDLWHTKEILKVVDGPERVRVERVIEYIEKCPIPKEMLDIHNAAAKGEGIKK